MESKRITEKQDAAYKDRSLKQTRTNENEQEQTNTQERFIEALSGLKTCITIIIIIIIIIIICTFVNSEK